ncbi:AAEL004208-PA [Aedes aegypti]|uniref:AAEL004208-PA n=1 Tax=Aedes aegypti TaxID=7159 RepID=Q17DI2_AEDAE|nr:AAEL004208-PA [Aedes aegypti]
MTMKSVTHTVHLSLLLPVSCAAVALLSFLLYYSVPAPLISSYSGSAELPPFHSVPFLPWLLPVPAPVYPFRLRIEGKFFRLRSTNYRRFIVPVPLSPFPPRLLPSNRCIRSGSALSDQLRPTNYRSRFCCRSGRFVFSLGWFRPVGVPVSTSPTTTERR